MRNEKLSYNPLYKQIYEIIYDRISKSIYKINEEIPSEKSLAKEFDVSISTIRQAVGLLVEEGLLIRKQGKGTFVTKNTIQLKFLGWIGEMKEGDRVIQEIIKIFEEKNTNLEIKYINASYEDIKKTYLNMVQKGESPDIVQIDNYWTSTLASMGLLESLDNLLPAKNLSGRYPDKDLKGGMYNGKIYSVAWGLGPAALIYNKKLANRFNLNLEKNLSLGAYYNICRKISNHPLNNDVFAFGFASNIDIVYNIYTFMLAFGADIIGNEDKIVINSDNALKAFNWLKKLLNNNKIIWAKNARELRDLLVKDRLVFLEDGPWIRGILKEKTGYNKGIDNYFGVIENPSSSFTRYSSFTRNHSLAISSMCERKDLAVEFIDSLSSDPEICNLYFKELGLLPSQKDILMSHSYREHEYYATFISQMEKARVLNASNPLFGKALKFVADAAYNILQKEVDIKKELEEKAYYLKMLYSE